MITILLALAGITGVGKSYYKDKICEKLNFEKIKIITTRAPRHGEVNNQDKIFVTQDELQDMINHSEIAYRFDLLGVTYAYTKEAVFSDKNTVFEMHYDTISDFKKICPHLRSIYLLPRDINVSKEMLIQRGLAPDVEIARLNEIDEHYNRITTDKELMSMFDYVLYNNYDKASEDAVINLVNDLLKQNGKV